MQDSEVESGETCRLVISWDTSPSAVVFRLNILADIYREHYVVQQNFGLVGSVPEFRG